jgi:putative membrane protein
MWSLPHNLLISWWGHWEGSGPPFPVFVFPLAWGVVLAGVVAAVLVGGSRNGARAARRSGEHVLAQRFASGEVNAEQYRSMLSVLARVGEG